MQSEFETACANAREDIPVPAFSLAAIRARQARAVPAKVGRRGAFAAIALGLSMAAIAAAAVIDQGHVTLTKSGGLVISAQTMTMNRRAKDADVAAAAAKMDFKVVLPDGLPPGTKIKNVTAIGTSGLALGYDLPGAWRRAHHYMNVIIVEPSALRGTAKEKQRMNLMLGGAMAAKHKNATASVWRIGNEDVFIQTSVLTSAEAEHIKAAMQKQAAR
jgi:hypothetical protein